jgi:hypothetical protein
MRYLATHHIYKEILPNVFTNTRVSSTLDTGKSVKEIIAKWVKIHFFGTIFLWNSSTAPISSTITLPDSELS